VELKTEATLEFTSDSAVFGALAATKMFCGEAVTNQENEYLGALDAAERGEITEPFLFIYAAGRPEPLRFVRE
jgi:heat shock protein HslJ